MKKKKAPKRTNPPRPPTVFISYTHEDASHKDWVLKLATDLRNHGVDAILDRWECKYGSELNLFMEQGIKHAGRVLLVCTPKYQKKADTGKGGVGYERLVVTTEIAKDIQTEKFICVLRKGTSDSAIPVFARSRLFIDFRNGHEYDERLLELLRDIHLAPQNPKPPVGRNPFAKRSRAKRNVLVKGSRSVGRNAAKEKPPVGDNPFTPDVIAAMNSPLRRRLSDTRTAVNHKFDIAGHEGFINVGLFDNGAPGELQIHMGKGDATIAGLTNTIAILTSIALQYGVPLDKLVQKLSDMDFEPNGFTKNPEIRQTSSIIDYIFRWMALQFIPGYREELRGSQELKYDNSMPGFLEEIKGKLKRPVQEVPVKSRSKKGQKS